MGIDFNDLFGQAKNAIDQAFNDVKKTGVPALEASLEKWGADALNKMAQDSQKTVDANVKEILARPQDPNGLGAYLANTFKSPVMQQYGGFIVVGLFAVAVGGYFIFRRA